MSLVDNDMKNFDKIKEDNIAAKNIVKNWEEEYNSHHGSKPDKEALKSAPDDIKDAYKMYWKTTKHLDQRKNQKSTKCNSDSTNCSDQDPTNNLDSTTLPLNCEVNAGPRENDVISVKKDIKSNTVSSLKGVWGKHLNKQKTSVNPSEELNCSMYSMMAAKMKNNATVKTRTSLKRVQSRLGTEENDNHSKTNSSSNSNDEKKEKTHDNYSRTNSTSNSNDEKKEKTHDNHYRTISSSNSNDERKEKTQDHSTLKDVSNQLECNGRQPSNNAPFAEINDMEFDTQKILPLVINSNLTKITSKSVNHLSIDSKILDQKLVSRKWNQNWVQRCSVISDTDAKENKLNFRNAEGVFNSQENNNGTNMSQNLINKSVSYSTDMNSSSGMNEINLSTQDVSTIHELQENFSLHSKRKFNDENEVVDCNKRIRISVTTNRTAVSSESAKINIVTVNNNRKKNCDKSITNGNEDTDYEEKDNSDCDYLPIQTIPKSKKRIPARRTRYKADTLGSKEDLDTEENNYTDIISEETKSEPKPRAKYTSKRVRRNANVLKKTRQPKKNQKDAEKNQSTDGVYDLDAEVSATQVSNIVIPEYDDLADMTSTKINVGSKRKFYTKQERLQYKMSTGKCNENFVKINLKKKVFVRGKRRISSEKYKRKEWEKKQIFKRAEDGDERSIKKLTCFKCGDFGHWSYKCPGKIGDNLIPISEYDEKECTFLTLDEASNLARGIKDSNEGTIIYPKKIVINSENSQKENSDDEILSDWDDDMVAEIEACEKRALSSFNTEEPPPPPNRSIKDALKNSIDPVYELNEKGKIIPTPEEVLDTLKLFGFESFRRGQEDAIMRILSGQSTLMVQSTGSGKSLCYQLPAYLYAQKSKCITLCVSPLVSLMEDQVSGLPHFLKAVCLHTQQSSANRDKAMKALLSGTVHILLVSPEAIVSSRGGGILGSLLKELPQIAFACLDEAHCLSEWSHNFRPSYLQVCRILRERFNVKTILGLTATATDETVISIAKHLQIPELGSGIIMGTCIPDNLKLSVSRDPKREEALIHLLTGERFSSCSSIIIYCTRREECERISTFIRSQMVNPSKIDVKSNSLKKRTISLDAEAYHAGLSGYRRQQIQKRFMSGKLRIVVATVAFGMGIDKADVQGIVHFNMPRNIESYVQEIGRAGRNGDISHCHLFLDTIAGKDIQELKRHIFANSVDRFTVRKLLNKVFATRTLLKSNKLDSANNENSNEVKPTLDLAIKYPGICSSFSNRHCPGHEVALPFDELIESLDLPEENIQTLLCYLEAQPECRLSLHHHVYATCKLSCYRGPQQLCAVSRKSPPLAAAIALQKGTGKSFEKTNSVTFPVVEVASLMGWESRVVKQELKKLEWDTSGLQVGRNLCPSGVKVEFSNLAFRLTCRCDLSDEEQDTLLESIYDRACVQEKDQLKKLQFTYDVLRKSSHGSIILCCDQVEEQRSDTIKESIREYFSARAEGSENPLTTVKVDEQLYIRPELETRVRSDIRSLLSIHSDQSWTGRGVARVLHGISSPNYPSKVWGRVRRFWRLHLATIDFNLLVSLATKEILKNK